jgi:RNA polymerase-interacting CarD/CdnL/TRCF family regulator
MGKMKWIYQMVQDGTSEDFIKVYLKARLQDKQEFIFDSQVIDIQQGRSIMREMRKADKEYNQHIDEQAQLNEIAKFLSIDL